MASGVRELYSTNSGLKARYVWSSTKNVSGNYSTVNLTVQVALTSGSFIQGDWTGMVVGWNYTSAMNSGGTVKYYLDKEINKSVRVTQDWTTLANYVFTVPHSNSGYGSCEVQITIEAPPNTVYAGTRIMTSDSRYGDVLSLGTISQQANITSAPNFGDEDNPTVNYSNPAGNSVTSLQMCISLDGSKDDVPYRDVPKTGTSYTFNLTEAERSTLRQATVGSDSRSVAFYLKTVVNGNTYYSKVWKTFAVTSSAPWITGKVEETDGNRIGLTGDKNIIIKGNNSLKFTIETVVHKEATLTHQSITCGKETIANKSTGTFTNVTENVFYFSATDSRGKTTNTSLTKLMVNYIKPTCNIALSNFSSSSSDGQLTISGNYFADTFGAVRNSIKIEYRIKLNDGSFNEWKQITTYSFPTTSTFTTTIPLGGLNYKYAYTIEARVTDKLNTVSSVETFNAYPVFDWGANDFNFNVPVSINGIELDYIVEQGAKNGWEYRKWNSGRAECWKSVTLTTAATTTWGALWRGDSFIERQTYPFNFSAKPVENVTIQSGSVGAWALPMDSGNGVNGASASGRYTVCRPASTSSAEYYLSFYVIGKWK